MVEQKVAERSVSPVRFGKVNRIDYRPPWAAWVDELRLVIVIGRPGNYEKIRPPMPAAVAAIANQGRFEGLGASEGVGALTTTASRAALDGPGADGSGADGPGTDGPGTDGPGADEPSGLEAPPTFSSDDLRWKRLAKNASLLKAGWLVGEGFVDVVSEIGMNFHSAGMVERFIPVGIH